MDEKRKNGLCYHCDEKYNPTYKCKRLGIYRRGGVAERKLEVSIHGISCTPSPITMRLMGIIETQLMVILANFGSTNNFLDP